MKVEEEIEQETKQDKWAAILDKGKAKEKESIEGFDTFIVEDIIGNVVSNIPNLTIGVEQPVHTSPVEEVDKTLIFR